MEISEERAFLAEGIASVTDQIYHQKVLSNTTDFILSDSVVRNFVGKKRTTSINPSFSCPIPAFQHKSQCYNYCPLTVGT